MSNDLSATPLNETDGSKGTDNQGLDSVTSECQPAPKPGYQPPKWAADAQHDTFALEVIKAGAVVDKIDISGKGTYIVGRTAKTCDIHLQHPSISRQHAVFQHKNDGNMSRAYQYA